MALPFAGAAVQVRLADSLAAVAIKAIGAPGAVGTPPVVVPPVEVLVVPPVPPAAPPVEDATQYDPSGPQASEREKSWQPDSSESASAPDRVTGLNRVTM